MNFFLASLSVLSLASILLILFRRRKRITEFIFLISLIAGCALGLMAAVSILLSRNPVDYRLDWRAPLGEFFIGIDSLSAFFLLTITVLFIAAGVYAVAYFQNAEHKKSLAGHFALYHVLLISLLLVATAKNAVLFLFAWEIMSISSYFLITFYDEKEAVRKAGYLYLIATHTGTFCLWVMFLLLGHQAGLPDGQAGSMNFDQMRMAQFPLALAGIIFVLGMIGFGVKAGFIPLHIWLPHAHPSAPAHISAVLSGVMIKMGIYGLMRLIFILKELPEWCASVLLLIGMVSGVGGVLYALGQHEIKKLLAYHSIENIGIITLGMGIGLWGQIHQQPLVALVGYAGGLLHVFNHAVFKGLLFLSAGSVIKITHTGEIDHLGGLLKRLPWTGHLFLIGSLSICGLPLFNGFISEWLVFRALFEGILNFQGGTVLLMGIAITALALIGGLALMCFTKAFGTIFLGQSRSKDISAIKENSWMMLAPMSLLAMVCLWIGIFPQTMVSLSLQGAANILSFSMDAVTQREILQPMLWIIFSLLILIGISGFLVTFKKMAMKNLPIEKTETWGCGYSAVTPRMQYTASSFAEPILKIFHNVLCLRESRVIDASEDFLFRPLFQGMKKILAKLKIIQCGYSQAYLLYIFIFLIVILIWKMV